MRDRKNEGAEKGRQGLGELHDRRCFALLCLASISLSPDMDHGANKCQSVSKSFCRTVGEQNK